VAILNRTRKALALLKENPKMTQREAARLVGLATHSGIGAAVRQERKTRRFRCAHCGSIIPYLRDALGKE
jgi:hypothetical protein